MGRHRRQGGRRVNQSRSYRESRGWGWFPPSVPLEAEGGIKAQSRSGAFGKQWWSQRWIEVLEGFRIGARLQRGKRYARKGQVTTLEIETALITGTVQGSRRTPYKVTIRLSPLSDAQWASVTESLQEQPILAASLLAGDLPPEIEGVFQEAQSPLFPVRLIDLKTDCSCPDWSNPCKHIAAVYYLIAESFDRDPFLLLKLRGRTREEFVGSLRKSRSPRSKPTSNGKPTKPAVARTPLPLRATRLNEFWAGAAPLPPCLPPQPVTPSEPLFLKRLGPIPFWQGTTGFTETLTTLCQKASHSAKSQGLI